MIGTIWNFNLLKQASTNFRNKKDYVQLFETIESSDENRRILASSRNRCNGLFAEFILSTLIL